VTLRKHQGNRICKEENREQRAGGKGAGDGTRAMEEKMRAGENAKTTRNDAGEKRVRSKK
jgi:hypothetical protein